jgi:hypothetical protein
MPEPIQFLTPSLLHLRSRSLTKFAQCCRLGATRKVFVPIWLNASARPPAGERNPARLYAHALQSLDGLASIGASAGARRFRGPLPSVAYLPMRTALYTDVSSAVKSTGPGQISLTQGPDP